jgi:hypothetical protein
VLDLPLLGGKGWTQSEFGFAIGAVGARRATGRLVLPNQNRRGFGIDLRDTGDRRQRRRRDLLVIVRRHHQRGEALRGAGLT